jgi:hypothetical protein
MIQKSPAKKMDTLAIHAAWDGMREETLFSPLLLNGKRLHSYSLTSSSKRNKAVRQDKLRNRPWAFVTQVPSVAMSMVMALVLNLVAKLVMYPAYSLSLAYSKLR